MNFRRNGRRKTLGSWRNIPCCPIRTLLLPPGKSPASPQRRRNLGPNRAWKARSVREAQPMKDLDDSRAPLLDHLIELRRRLLYCVGMRSEEHTSELQSLMRISYAVFCLKKQSAPRN